MLKRLKNFNEEKWEDFMERSISPGRADTADLTMAADELKPGYQRVREILENSHE
jgi:hypothetical protein